MLKVSDIPDAVDEKSPPGAILSIEGGDPLEDKPDRVDEFYHLGVRMITLVHYQNNALGDIMRAYENLAPGRAHNGLTPPGRKVVERMQELGMVVDVTLIPRLSRRSQTSVPSRWWIRIRVHARLTIHCNAVGFVRGKTWNGLPNRMVSFVLGP